MPSVFVEPWPTSVSGPYLIAEDDEEAGDCPVVEDDGEFRLHGPSTVAAGHRVAFVDGVRRAEARLYQQMDDRTAFGVAGAHGHGAVLCETGMRPRFDRNKTDRMVVWGSGAATPLPAVHGGWVWRTYSVVADGPEAPLQEVQRLMREAEGVLAEDLADHGWLTIVDGPLNFIRSKERTVVGYVKTHHRALLPLEFHARVPELTAGQRTSLFAKREDIYSCYLRLADPPRFASPWAGIARLEFPTSEGREAVIAAADAAASLLPPFAGIAHKDPRAPQNLQPISKLEQRLHHRLGDRGLAMRAVRRAALQAT